MHKIAVLAPALLAAARPRGSNAGPWRNSGA